MTTLRHALVLAMAAQWAAPARAAEPVYLPSVGLWQTSLRPESPVVGPVARSEAWAAASDGTRATLVFWRPWGFDCHQFEPDGRPLPVKSVPRPGPLYAHKLVSTPQHHLLLGSGAVQLSSSCEVEHAVDLLGWNGLTGAALDQGWWLMGSQNAPAVTLGVAWSLDGGLGAPVDLANTHWYGAGGVGALVWVVTQGDAPNASPVWARLMDPTSGAVLAQHSFAKSPLHNGEASVLPLGRRHVVVFPDSAGSWYRRVDPDGGLVDGVNRPFPADSIAFAAGARVGALATGAVRYLDEAGAWSAPSPTPLTNRAQVLWGASPLAVSTTSGGAVGVQTLSADLSDAGPTFFPVRRPSEQLAPSWLPLGDAGTALWVDTRDGVYALRMLPVDEGHRPVGPSLPVAELPSFGLTSVAFSAGRAGAHLYVISGSTWSRLSPDADGGYSVTPPQWSGSVQGATLAGDGEHLYLFGARFVGVGDDLVVGRVPTDGGAPDSDLVRLVGGPVSVRLVGAMDGPDLIAAAAWRAFLGADAGVALFRVGPTDGGTRWSSPTEFPGWLGGIAARKGDLCLFGSDLGAVVRACYPLDGGTVESVQVSVPAVRQVTSVVSWRGADWVLACVTQPDGGDASLLLALREDAGVAQVPVAEGCGVVSRAPGGLTVMAQQLADGVDARLGSAVLHFLDVDGPDAGAASDAGEGSDAGNSSAAARRLAVGCGCDPAAGSGVWLVWAALLSLPPLQRRRLRVADRGLGARPCACSLLSSGELAGRGRPQAWRSTTRSPCPSPSARAGRPSPGDRTPSGPGASPPRPSWPGPSR